MATHSSIHAWRIPGTEEPGGLQVMGLQRDMTEHLSTCLIEFFIVLIRNEVQVLRETVHSTQASLLLLWTCKEKILSISII